MDLLFFPIDTLKTRLQSAQGFIGAGGFKGVYRGVGSVLVGSAPGGVRFAQRRQIRIEAQRVPALCGPFVPQLPPFSQPTTP